MLILKLRHTTIKKKKKKKNAFILCIQPGILEQIVKTQPGFILFATESAEFEVRLKLKFLDLCSKYEGGVEN